MPSYSYGSYKILQSFITIGSLERSSSCLSGVCSGNREVQFLLSLMFITVFKRPHLEPNYFNLHLPLYICFQLMLTLAGAHDIDCEERQEKMKGTVKEYQTQIPQQSQPSTTWLLRLRISWRSTFVVPI
jgi:hypothetical protein